MGSTTVIPPPPSGNIVDSNSGGNANIPPPPSGKVVDADPTKVPGAVGEAMSDEGVTDYKPGQGIPFGHYGAGIRTGDITPTQAKEGAHTIAAVSLGAALPEVVAGAKALVPAATKGLQAVTAWAEAHPVLARAVYEGIKGAAWYKILKKVSGVANAE